jgi:WD40 repeat protein
MTRRALFISPYNAVTCGADGTVRLFSYAARRQLFSTVFAAPATFLAVAPLHVDRAGRAAVVGFDDGVVRVLRRCADSWKLIGCVKPHKQAVTAAAYSPSGRTLATASADATAGALSTTITRPTLISSSSSARLYDHSLSG